MNLNLFENIAQLANLQYGNTVLIKESSEIKMEMLQFLVDVGLCPSRAWLYDKYPNISRNLQFKSKENLSRRFPSEVSIIDILGQYYSTRKEIVIFTNMCEIVAESLGIGVDVLRKVVEAHEIAHAVTHLGTDMRGDIWENFDKATSEDKELFAQIYPLLFFNVSGDTEAEDCFRKLSEHQVSRYNSWCGYDDISLLAQINRDLLDARLKRTRPLTILKSGVVSSKTGTERIPAFDTIIVPAKEVGFKNVFLGENRWWPIRMSADIAQADKIKFIAVYRKAPKAAITHWAPVKNILRWQNTNYFVVNFAEPAREINPIHLIKNGKVKAPQLHRYTSFSKLKKAKNMDDLI